MLDNSNIQNLDKDLISSRNQGKLNAIVELSRAVLDNVANTKDDILYKPATAADLGAYTSTINEIITNKLVLKFK